MTGDARKRIDPGTNVDLQPEVGGGGVEGRGGDQRKWSGAQLTRVEPEDKMVHDRVADNAQLEDITPIHSGLRDQLAEQVVEGASHHVGEPGGAVIVHHHVRDAAHQILAKSDLGIHHATRSENHPGQQIAEMAGNCGRADIEGHPEGEVTEAGPDPDQIPGVTHRHSHRPVSCTQGRLEISQDRRFHHQSAQTPLLFESGEETLQVSGRAGKIGLGNLDVMEPDDGIDRQGRHTGPLAHHLAMDLAVGRDIDDDVVRDLRSTAQTMAGA